MVHCHWQCMCEEHALWQKQPAWVAHMCWRVDKLWCWRHGRSYKNKYWRALVLHICQCWLSASLRLTRH